MNLLAVAAFLLPGCGRVFEYPQAGPPEPREPRPSQWERDRPTGSASAPGKPDPRSGPVLRGFIARALEQYRGHCTCYPSTEEGLAALFSRPAGNPRWRGPYLDGRPPVVDPWGREFSYTSDRLTYHLVSAGEDGAFGTADDIGGKP